MSRPEPPLDTLPLGITAVVLVGVLGGCVVAIALSPLEAPAAVFCSFVLVVLSLILGLGTWDEMRPPLAGSEQPVAQEAVDELEGCGLPVSTGISYEAAAERAEASDPKRLAAFREASPLITYTPLHDAGWKAEQARERPSGEFDGLHDRLLRHIPDARYAGDE